MPAESVGRRGTHRRSGNRSHLRLLEEAFQLPEAALLFALKRVVVALRALHLNAQQEASRHGGGRHRVVVEVRQQEIGGRVVFGRPFGRHELVNDFVPGSVGGKAIAKEFFQHVAAHARSAGLPADQQVGPNRGPVAGEIGLLEQLVDNVRPLRRAVFVEEFVDGRFRRDMAGQVEIHAAEPLGIAGRRRGLDSCRLPALLQPRVEKGDDVPRLARMIGRTFGVRRSCRWSCRSAAREWRGDRRPTRDRHRTSVRQPPCDGGSGRHCERSSACSMS